MKFIKLILSPKELAVRLLRYTAQHWSDVTYIKLKYWVCTGKFLNLKNPSTYWDKLNWMKLNYRRDDLWKYVDKYEAKKIAACIIGEEHIVKCLGVYDSFDEIDFSNLPDSFVMKCTHDSGSYIICKDKKKLNIKQARKKIEKGLKRNYFYNSREYPYKKLIPRIIIEEYLEDHKTDNLKDYKFFCFNGEPKVMYVSTDASQNAHTDFFDMEYNPLKMYIKDPNSDIPPDKPSKFEELKQFAKLLCIDFPHVRVDFYVVNDVVYFGEYTFYHNGGNSLLHPTKWNKIWGQWIILPPKVNPFKSYDG